MTGCPDSRPLFATFTAEMLLIYELSVMTIYEFSVWWFLSKYHPLRAELFTTATTEQLAKACFDVHCIAKHNVNSVSPLLAECFDGIFPATILW